MFTYNLTNNETYAAGIVKNIDKTYTALTPTTSKDFKTVKGAAAWLAKRGFNADGTRM